LFADYKKLTISLSV